MRKTYKKQSDKKLTSKKRTGASTIKEQKVSTVKVSSKKASVKASVGKINNRISTKEANGEKAVKNTISTINKQYLKSNGFCNVTFKLPKEAAPDAEVVTIVGDFNNWDFTETKMKKLKTGDFRLTLKLHKNNEYRFRYLIDDSRWENDWCADKYIPNQYGCDDSLVIV